MEMIRYYALHLAAVLDKTEVDIPKDSSNNPIALNSAVVGKVMQVAFGFAGGIALIMIVIGGFKYINSLGNPQNVAKAKDTILYAIIGLVVCISGYAIVSFVVTKVGP